MMGRTYDSITHSVVEIRYRHLISCSQAQKNFELSGPPKKGDPRGCVVVSTLHTADRRPRCQQNKGESGIKENTSGSRVSGQTGTRLNLHRAIRNSKVSQVQEPHHSVAIPSSLPKDGQPR